MRQHAQVVIIGGGAVGCSVLYHLAQLGMRDTVLLERDELTSGSTWHAAGNVPNFSTSWTLMRMQRYSSRLYSDLCKDPEHGISYHVTGSIRLAHSRDRLDELKHVAAQGRALGIELEILSPAEIRGRHPFIETAGLVAALWDPHDGNVDPAQLTQAFAREARRRGAEIHRHTRVNALERASTGEWRVMTDQGAITAEIVVNAAGYRGGEIAAMAEQYLPMVTLSHQYLVTQTIPELAARGAARLPLLRDPDVSYYLRQDQHGLLLGPYEWQATAHWLAGIPAGFANQLFEDDLLRIESYLEAACERVPVLRSAGIRRVVNGPIPYAPDGNPLMGPAAGLRGLYHCCAFTFGIAQAGGAGKVLAEWIASGQPEWDPWCVDSRRFLPFADQRYTLARAIETYQQEYAIGYPIEERAAGRPAKCSPLYPSLASKGARFGARAGWERPVYFASDLRATNPGGSFRRPSWHADVARECAVVAERVGVLDAPGFSRFEVSGPDAGGWINHLITGAMPTPGRTMLCYLCNERGGIVTEMTLTAWSPERYWLVGAGAGELHDEDWLRGHLPSTGGVHVENLSSRIGALIVAGPKSRALLSELTSADLSTARFPWMAARTVSVGNSKVQAMRVSYVGELGYELHVPVEESLALYELLCCAGDRHGARDFGLYALESLRLEKCYRSWKAELTIECTPMTASLERFVRFDKAGGFIGREALGREPASRPCERLVPLIVESLDADASPASCVFDGPARVGMVTSGGYGHRLGQSIALAYVQSDRAQPGRALEVEILGERRPARVGREPLYDPENLRLRA